MGKRSNAGQAIANLTDGDLIAIEKKASLLANVPAPVYVDAIDRMMVRANKDFNVRELASYGEDANKALYASLRENGLLRHNPMVFSRQNDGTLLAIAGNIRFGAMGDIDADNVAKGRPKQFDTIYGLVYSGLSAEQETLLMADHAIARGLNEAETAKAIGELWEKYPSLTDEKVGIYFGIDKSKAQRLRMVYSMPIVFEEFRKEKSKDKDVPFVKVGQTALTQLYTAAKTDRDSGLGYREVGPVFRAAWSTFVNGQSIKAVKPPTPTAKDRTKIVDQASAIEATYGTSVDMLCVRDILLWAANENGSDGSEIILPHVITRLHDYCLSLVKQGN